MLRLLRDYPFVRGAAAVLVGVLFLRLARRDKSERLALGRLGFMAARGARIWLGTCGVLLIALGVLVIALDTFLWAAG